MGSWLCQSSNGVICWCSPVPLLITKISGRPAGTPLVATTNDSDFRGMLLSEIYVHTSNSAADEQFLLWLKFVQYRLCWVGCCCVEWHRNCSVCQTLVRMDEIGRESVGKSKFWSTLPSSLCHCDINLKTHRTVVWHQQLPAHCCVSFLVGRSWQQMWNWYAQLLRLCICCCTLYTEIDQHLTGR